MDIADHVSSRIATLLMLVVLGMACDDTPPPNDDDDDSTTDDDDSAADDDDSAADDDDSATDDDDSAADDDDSRPPQFLQGALIITEIFNNPMGTDEGREWFELLNPGAVDIDLLGWTLEDFHTNHYSIAESVLVPAGGYAVLGESTKKINLGTPVNFGYGLDTNGFPLGNNTDEIVLRGPAGVIVDSVAYDGGGTFPSAEGQAISLSPAATNHFANDMGWNWCLSAAGPFTAEGDLGSPGLPNPEC